MPCIINASLLTSLASSRNSLLSCLKFFDIGSLHGGALHALGVSVILANHLYRHRQFGKLKNFGLHGVAAARGTSGISIYMYMYENNLPLIFC